GDDPCGLHLWTPGKVACDRGARQNQGRAPRATAFDSTLPRKCMVGSRGQSACGAKLVRASSRIFSQRGARRSALVVSRENAWWGQAVSPLVARSWSARPAAFSPSVVRAAARWLSPL